MGFIVCRYAHTALMSSSVKLAYISHGIGGRMAAPSGFFPVRNMARNVASVYFRDTKPVSGSGVRFDAEVVPQGPVQAVRSRDV
jgi:hypothetical protein